MLQASPLFPMFISAGILALALAVAAAPSPYAVKESIVLPRGWTREQAAPADHVIDLRIALPQPNFDVLERHLYEISDPEHPRYSQHLSKEEVEELVAPHPDSLSAVEEWLAENGIPIASYSPARDWVHIKISVSTAEQLLETKYNVYTHKDGDSVIRTESYSLPSHLHSHVDLVTPTISFARFKTFKSTVHYPDYTESVEFDSAKLATGAAAPGGVDPSCNATVTLSCLKQLYNINYKPKLPKGSGIGITGYLNQYLNNADQKLFYADQLPEAVNSTYKFFSVKGGLNDQNISKAGAEANLDGQFAFGLAYPIPGTFWSTAGSPPFNPSENTPTNTNEPYQDWLDFVLGQKQLPYSISTSYGEDEISVPESYARRACAGFAQLGARGVSLLFSSGDGGVGDGSTDPNDTACHSNDGKNTTMFLPTFPAGCPYVTAVGGTNNVPEIAVFFSGGGFSNYFPRPAYQTKVVKEYLAKLPKGVYKGLYNPNGRAFPDVAALGRRYRIFYQGKPISIGGTSASAPTFAAVVALLNDARLSKGKAPLGFLNPLLYSKGISGFNDITAGNNPGCGTPGFNATAGWDPVTGLGTPNFGKLLELIG